MLKFLQLGFIILLLLFIAALSVPSLLLTINARNKIYNNPAYIPKNHVGLVLGTTNKTRSGAENLYFKYRVKAAVELYRAHKINIILVSGDNSSRYYNETANLYRALVKAGVAHQDIVMDFAGFRTLDSIVRAKKVFGLQRFTIISQEFHNKRALYLAKHNGIDAIAYNAKQPSQHCFMQMRELLARIKLMLDLMIGIDPKFLGQPIDIPRQSTP